MLPPGRAATFHLRHLLRTFQLPSPYRLLLQPAVLSSSPACSRRRAASPSVRRPPLPPPPSLPAPPLFPHPCRSPPHMLFPRQTNPRPPLHAAKGRPGGPSALLLLLISKERRCFDSDFFARLRAALPSCSGFPMASAGLVHCH